MEKAGCLSFQEQIIKAWFLDTVKFYSSIKKDEKFGEMELDITILNGVTQIQNKRNQCCMLSLTHGDTLGTPTEGRTLVKSYGCVSKTYC